MTVKRITAEDLQTDWVMAHPEGGFDHYVMLLNNPHLHGLSAGQEEDIATAAEDYHPIHSISHVAAYLQGMTDALVCVGYCAKEIKQTFDAIGMTKLVAS